MTEMGRTTAVAKWMQGAARIQLLAAKQVQMDEEELAHVTEMEETVWQEGRYARSLDLLRRGRTDEAWTKWDKEQQEHLKWTRSRQPPYRPCNCQWCREEARRQEAIIRDTDRHHLRHVGYEAGFYDEERDWELSSEDEFGYDNSLEECPQCGGTGEDPGVDGVWSQRCGCV